LFFTAATLVITVAVGSGPTQAVGVACATVVETPGRIVSVRSGPGKTHRRIYRLRSGQMVSTDSRLGDAARRWAHVDAVLARKPDGRRFEAATFDGWVYARYLDIYECP
jgi:hypothetical protein